MAWGVASDSASFGYRVPPKAGKYRNLIILLDGVGRCGYSDGGCLK